MAKRSLIGLYVPIILALWVLCPAAAAGTRIALDGGAYYLPNDDLLWLPEGIYRTRLALRLSAEFPGSLPALVNLEIRRFEQEPIPITTYSDPYGLSGLAYKPRLWDFAFGVQPVLRLQIGPLSPYLAAGPALTYRHLDVEELSTSDSRVVLALDAALGLDWRPAQDRPWFLGVGGRFFTSTELDGEASDRVEFKVANTALGWFARVGFILR